METYIRLRLRKCDFFGGLPDEELARLAKAAFVRELSKTELLFHQGQPCTALYCLDTGRIQLVRSGESGGEVIIRTVRPGDVFAEAALFEERRFPVTARAVVRSRVFGFQRQDFMALLAERSFREAFLAMLMRRLRYLAARVETLTAENTERRLARYLFEQYGRATEVYVDLAKKDVAAAIATTPETLSRMLKKLEQQKLLTWKGHVLQVADGFWTRYLPPAI